MEKIYVLSFVTAFFFIHIVSASVHDQLLYFETLKISDIQHRTKRSTDLNPNSHITEVKIKTLGRLFHLYLKPANILSRGFKASVVRANGRSEPIHIDEGALLSGRLADDRKAVVNLNYEENGNILANINTEDDTYIIEPSWRLLDSSDNHTMISYRRSDMKLEHPGSQNLHSTCGIKEGDYDPELHGQIEVTDSDDVPMRVKRAPSPYLGARTSCQLMVVADYRFFHHMGGSSVSHTAIYMINVIQIVSSIYQITDFDSSGQEMIGVGFEIGEMRIHNESHGLTEELQGHPHYNQPLDWATKDLLESFSMDGYLDNFCLAHLFTYQSFSDGVLGLAYIASERRSAVGGICSPRYPKYRGVQMTLNTGWSSSQNAGGQRVLALQAQLVTAHELGHNMGSEHDTETDECAPSDYGDGKYIMYPWAVSGYDSNNRLFSPCSKEFIFKVLKAKGYKCFIEGHGNGAFCGNGRIDEGEECDAGWNTKNDLDPCCNNECALRPGMLCSPMNFGCCTEQCQPAVQGTVCRPAMNMSCEGEIKCDGVNKHCPNVSSILLDGTQCIDQGKCIKGQCLNFCQMFDPDLTPCICAKDSGNACHRCCKNRYSSTEKCSSVNNTLLPDGRPCYQGLCTQGVCEKKRQDMVQRLFNIIEDISIDQLVEFMRSNIVGTVIVLSLLIWIPASCTVSIIDRKQSRKEKSKRDWMSRSNRTLFMEEDSKLIRRVNIRNPPRPVAGSVVRPLGEPTVRWPESTMEASRPTPPPSRPLPTGPPTHHFLRTANRNDGLDIGPDHESVV